MIDIRYHIVSLIAVFLALSLGIILGTVIVDKGVIVDQQKALVTNLQKEFNELRENNRDLQHELDKANEFEDSVYDQIISNALENKNIAIISTTNMSESVQSELRKAFNKAGADVFFIRIKKSTFDQSKNLNKISDYFPEENLKRDELWQKLLIKLSTDIASSNDTAFIKTLIGDKIILTAGNVSIPTNQVILAGGRENDELSKFEEVDKILIDTLLNYEVNLVGVETTKADKSFMKQYQIEGLSTVDNIESIPGRVALIYVMAGNEGRYGTKSTAQSLMPPIISGKEN